MKTITSKKIYTILTAGALIAASALSLAGNVQAAVEFNTFPLSYTPSQNHDLPLIDARNFTDGGAFSTSQDDHNNGVQADPGEVVEFQIYYHNGAAASEVAHNVIAQATLPGGTRNTHEVSASIDSDETSPISSSNHGGNIAININGQAQTLEFISGSVRHFPDRASRTVVPPNGDNLLTGGINLGNIQGCFEFSGFVTFKARVGSGVQADRNLTINKRVLNASRGDSSFQDSVSASPNERVRFEIRFETTGNQSQSGVTVRDALPNRLNFVSGTVRENGSSVSSSYESDLIFGSGRNLGTFPAGTARAITFEANVDGSGSFSGSTTVVNTASVRSSEVSERQDSASVNVNVIGVDQNLTIDKRVLNVSRGDSSFQDSVTANPGDRVRFEIRVNTSGNASQSNVILRDILPSQLTFISGTFRQDGQFVGNESGFFGSGVNLGSLPSNSSRTFSFEANVAGSGVFSGATTLTNTANVRSDQVSTRQNDAVVNVQVVGSAQFTLRKAAWNLTKNADATTVPADPGDIITYTLYYKNTGGITLNNVVIEDNIHDVLELSEITNQGGAVSVNSVIRYSPVDIFPGVEIARTFQVRVRNQSLFPAGSDLLMVNIYGNEVRVQVRRPTVGGVTTPPRTGPGEWISVSLAGLATAGYWLYRRKKTAQIAGNI